MPPATIFPLIFLGKLSVIRALISFCATWLTETINTLVILPENKEQKNKQEAREKIVKEQNRINSVYLSRLSFARDLRDFTTESIRSISYSTLSFVQHWNNNNIVSLYYTNYKILQLPPLTFRQPTQHTKKGKSAPWCMEETQIFSHIFHQWQMLHVPRISPECTSPTRPFGLLFFSFQSFFYACKYIFLNMNTFKSF